MRLGLGSVCSCNFSPHLLRLPESDSMLLALQEGEVTRPERQRDKLSENNSMIHKGAQCEGRNFTQSFVSLLSFISKRALGDLMLHSHKIREKYYLEQTGV